MKIEELVKSRNIAVDLADDILDKIGYRVFEDYEIDQESRKEWLEKNKKAMELATQVVEAKSEPFEGAANVKYPTLSMAAVQFASRAYPQLVKGTDVVKGRVIGEDPGGGKAGKAQRVSTHMSWQLLVEMEEWEDDTDSLLIALPIEGSEFKKTYFSPDLGRNVSEWVRPEHLVVNYNAKSLEKASRKTHIIPLLPNEIIERVRGGIYLDILEFEQPPTMDDETKHDTRDEDAPHIFYEQHRFWDLDDDGYKEPYIVTLHKDSKKVVRIVARYSQKDILYNIKDKVRRINPTEYFTHYKFMPSPDGGFYGMGFGTLLGPINTSINMTLNQLHDSGTLANLQGGFIGKSFAGGRGRGAGDLRFKMGEWKQVNYSGDDIRKAIMTLPFKEPSMVLFQLLGLLIEAGEKMGNLVDPLMGESPGANVPATTVMALIEQGLKVFSSVFKRLHRSLQRELKKLFRLNSIFLPDKMYFTVLDNPQITAREDYDPDSFDVTPVSDPNQVSETQQILKAQSLMEMLQNGMIPPPFDHEVKRRYLESLQIPEIDKILPAEPQPQQPDPKVMMEMEELKIKQGELQLKWFKAQHEVVQMHAKSIEHLAKAEGVEVGQQITLYTEQMRSITEQMKMEEQRRAAQSQTTSPAKK